MNLLRIESIPNDDVDVDQIAFTSALQYQSSSSSSLF